MSKSSDHTVSLGLSVREWLLVIILTFPVYGTLFPLGSYMASALDADSGVAPAPGSDATIVLALTLLYVIFLFSRQPQKTIQSFQRNFIIFLFLGWSFLTSQWSYEPGLSFNRTGRMLVFALYALYVVDFLPSEKTRRLLFISMGLSCAISMLFIIGVPSLSRMLDARGSWRGAMMHKNVLGSMAAMILLFALMHWRLKLIGWRSGLPAALVGAVLLHLSNNVGSLVSVIVILGLMWYVVEIANRTRHPLVSLIVGGAVFAAVGILISNSDFIFDALGRDKTLTGRDEVGEFARMMIDVKPIWGWGMGAWSSADFQDIVGKVLIWHAPNAHNAWLDFRLQLGLPGLIVAAVMWILAGVNVLRLMSRRKIAQSVFPVSIYIFLSIRTYAETVMTDPSLTEMFWFAFAYAAITKAIAASDVPARARARREQLQVRRFGGDVVPAS